MNAMPVVIRQEYLALMNGDHCAAAILNAFEMWSEGKPVWIKKTQSQLKTDLLDFRGLNRTGMALKALEEKGFVVSSGDLGFGVAREYQINLDRIDAELCNKGLERTVVPVEEDLDVSFVSSSPTPKRSVDVHVVRQQPGYVYLIKAANGLYKIGITKNVVSRFNGLKTMSPDAIELIHFVVVSDTRGVEKRLHQQFAACRQHGEWFALNDNDVEYIKGVTS